MIRSALVRSAATVCAALALATGGSAIAAANPIFTNPFGGDQVVNGPWRSEPTGNADLDRQCQIATNMLNARGGDQTANVDAANSIYGCRIVANT